jgi:hypothetical protein
MKLKLFLGALGLLFSAALVSTLPDIQRYLKMRAM